MPPNTTTLPSDPTPSKDQRYTFYLHRPRTTSTRRVFIPLSSTTPLADALRGKTIEEFPTIYYFPATSVPHILPEQFILDEDYRQEEGEQQREFEELMKDVDPEILRRLRDEGSAEGKGEEVDGRKILDVLKRDLGAL